MSEEDIESNKKICVLMGAPHCTRSYAQELKYHCSFDALMPVIRRIRDQHDMKTVSNTIAWLLIRHSGRNARAWNDLKEIYDAVSKYADSQGIIVR